jgi:RimJ/RimL family protein N-acetyltransferase
MAERWTAEGVGKWLAHDRSNGSLVGGGFTRFDVDGEAALELGWAVRDALTGRGYATDFRSAIAARNRVWRHRPCQHVDCRATLDP